MPTKKRSETAPQERRDIAAASKDPAPTRTGQVRKPPAPTPPVPAVTRQTFTTTPDQDGRVLGEVIRVPAWADRVVVRVEDAYADGRVELRAAQSPEEMADGLPCTTLHVGTGMVGVRMPYDFPPRQQGPIYVARAVQPGDLRTSPTDDGVKVVGTFHNSTKAEIIEPYTGPPAPRWPQYIQVQYHRTTQFPVESRCTVAIEFERKEVA